MTGESGLVRVVDGADELAQAAHSIEVAPRELQAKTVLALEPRARPASCSCWQA